MANNRIDHDDLPVDGRPMVRDREETADSGDGPGIGRRDALRALVAAVVGMGGLSGVASAQTDPQGSACEWAGNVDAAGYDLFNLARLHGPLTGEQFVHTLNGENLTIDDGTLNAAGGSGGSATTYWNDSDGDSKLETESSYDGIDVQEVQLGGTLALGSVPATGTATLSSGKATVSTGVTDQMAELTVQYGMPNATSTVDVAPSLQWNNSSGEYEIIFEEIDTSVGNPDVAYRVIRSA